jgi:hypothetical protein
MDRWSRLTIDTSGRLRIIRPAQVEARPTTRGRAIQPQCDKSVTQPLRAGSNCTGTYFVKLIEQSESAAEAA